MVLDMETYVGEYMISGGLNGGINDVAVGIALLVNLILASVDIVETATLVPSILNLFAMGGLVGVLGGSMILLFTTIIYVAVIDDVKTNVDLWYAYLEGDDAAGDQLVENMAINILFTGMLTLITKAIKVYADDIIRANTAKYIDEAVGEPVGEIFMKDAKDPAGVNKAVKALDKGGISRGAIKKAVTEAGEDGLIKAGKLVKKGVSPSLLEKLIDNPTVLNKYGDDVLALFKGSSKSADEIVELLAKHGDDAVSLYWLYGDNVVAPILKHGDSAVDGIRRYGNDYLMLFNAHGDEFAGAYAKQGDEAVDAYLKYGDEAWKVLDDDPVTNPGDDIIETSRYSERLNELRNLLPDKYQEIDSYGNKIGNVAYSISNIDGYTIGEIKSFSKYGNIGQNGIKNPVEGWISSVENPAYSDSVLKVNSDNEIDAVNGYLRNNDTEYKIIEYYNQTFKENYNLSGEIIIVSEREICPSCDNVVKSFSKDYNNIEIVMIDGGGNYYIVKGGVVQ